MEQGLASSAALDVIAGTNATGYSSVAAMVFLIWDILITLDDEVEYIWPSPWTIPKFCFFFLRYFTLSLHITTMFLGTPPYTFTARQCYGWGVYQALASLLLITTVDYVLLVRIFAIYPRNRAVKWITIGGYITELVIVAVGFGLSVPKLVTDEYCTVLDAPPTFVVAAGAPIVFQAFLFVLTMVKFTQALKEGWGDVPLMRLLVRDGTWAFILLFAIFIGEALLYGFAPSAYTSILYGWLNTAFAFCGYRILLNINGTGQPAPRGQTDTSTRPTIQFTTVIPRGADTVDPDESYSYSMDALPRQRISGREGRISEGDA